MTERKIEMYHVSKTYLEGWFTLQDLKRILEAAQRIEDVNQRLAIEVHVTMDETIPVPEVGWLTLPSA